MKVKKKFIGTFVYSHSMAKMIEVKEENIDILIQDNLKRFLLNDTPRKKRNKQDSDNSKGDNDNI